MNSKFLLLVLSMIFSITAVFPAMACEVDAISFMVKSPVDCPKDTVAYLKTLGECSHFAGEEAYDEARRKFLEDAFKRLHCDRLAHRHKTLLRKYSKNHELIELLKEYSSEY